MPAAAGASSLWFVSRAPLSNEVTTARSHQRHRLGTIEASPKLWRELRLVYVGADRGMYVRGDTCYVERRAGSMWHFLSEKHPPCPTLRIVKESGTNIDRKCADKGTYGV